MPQRQRGLSLIGLLIVSGLLVFVAIVGFKLVPTYIEYFTIKRVISDIANSPEGRGGAIRDVQAAFDRRAQIDAINSIRGSDLEVEKTDSGSLITAAYTVRVPLFANVSACIDFEARSGK